MKIFSRSELMETQKMPAKIDWVFVVKKRLSWISEMLQVQGISKQYFQESIGVDFEFRNARMIIFHEYLDAVELDKLNEFILQQLQEDKNYLHRVAEKSYERCNRYEKLGIELANIAWSTKDDDELLKLFDEFYHQSLLMIPVVYFEPNLTDKIKTLLLEKLKLLNKQNEVEEYFLFLTSTAKELTIIKEQRNLLSIGATIQENSKLTTLLKEDAPAIILSKLPEEVVDQLKKHAEDYGWINTDDMFGRSWTETDLIARLRHLIQKDCMTKLKEAEKRQIEREMRYHQILEELSLDNETLKLIEIARENSHLRTHRTEIYVKTMHQASQMIDELAKRIGLNYQNALYFSLDELRQATISRNPISNEELNKRKSGMAYIMIDRNLEVFFGDQAHKLADDAGIADVSVERITQIEGAIANMGKVRGIVKVVHDISELEKVEDGDILVASMTIPEFVPAMEKAAAFVTDEGGITCHAAIVSREMGVPCVIGTEIATKVLRDGNLVEVDANEGVIRIIA